MISVLNSIFDSKIISAVETKLESCLSNPDAMVLLDAMRYSSLNGGKRIRPLLTIAGGKVGDADLDTVLNIGTAIELIHCYSLVHDDLPAMDNDDLRRGLPTCHKKYNEAIAILAGDALQAQAFVLLSSACLPLLPQMQLKIIHLIANCSGAAGMVGGQAIDLMSTGVNISLVELQHMHRQKTGALIKAAVLSGYLASANYQEQIYCALNSIADNLGLLFQITDDILDATASTLTLGKTANKDLANNKATYVSILGLKEAQNKALNLYKETIAALSKLSAHDELTELTHFIYNRSN